MAQPSRSTLPARNALETKRAPRLVCDTAASTAVRPNHAARVKMRPNWVVAHYASDSLSPPNREKVGVRGEHLKINDVKGLTTRAKEPRLDGVSTHQKTRMRMGFGDENWVKLGSFLVFQDAQKLYKLFYFRV